MRAMVRAVGGGALSGILVVSGCTSAPTTTSSREPEAVAVRLPPAAEAELPQPAAAPTAAPNGTAASTASQKDMVALLAADAGEHQKRLDAMTKARQRAQTEKPVPPTQSTPPTPSKSEAALAASPSASPSPRTSPAVEKSIATSSNSPASSSVPVASAAPVPPPAVMANAASTPDVKAAAEALVTALGAQAETGRPVARAMAEAALAMRDPTRPFDVSAFPGLDDDEKNLVRRLHDAFAAIGRDLASGKSASEAATSLASLTAALGEPKNLSVPRVELCTKVEGFGRVTALDNRRFLPGRATQVILYTEVDDFASERDASSSEWVTTLVTKVAIYAKHDGTQVWSRDWQAVTDKSSVKRDDFFICERLTLSDFLTVGTYVLKSSIRDEKSGAVAEKSVEFQIVADPALASESR